MLRNFFRVDVARCLGFAGHYPRINTIQRAGVLDGNQLDGESWSRDANFFIIFRSACRLSSVTARIGLTQL